jgi:prepilin-type N-terminal cleavage/methylation domain-containing protein
MRRRSLRRGFTLMEVLVAAMIGAIVTASLTLAVTTALESRARLERRVDEDSTARLVLATLERDLRAAYLSEGRITPTLFVARPPESAGNAPLLRLSTLSHRLEGPRREMRYRSGSTTRTYESETPAAPQADACIATYRLRQAPEGMALYRSQSLLTAPEETTRVFNEEEPLADRLAEIELRYWDGEAWQMSWETPPRRKEDLPPRGQEQPQQEERRLPAAVQLRVVLHTTDGSQRMYRTIIAVPASRLAVPSLEDVRDEGEESEEAPPPEDGPPS